MISLILNQLQPETDAAESKTGVMEKTESKQKDEKQEKENQALEPEKKDGAKATEESKSQEKSDLASK